MLHLSGVLKCSVLLLTPYYLIIVFLNTMAELQNAARRFYVRNEIFFTGGYAILWAALWFFLALNLLGQASKNILLAYSILIVYLNGRWRDLLGSKPLWALGLFCLAGALSTYLSDIPKVGSAYTKDFFFFACIGFAAACVLGWKALSLTLAGGMGGLFISVALAISGFIPQERVWHAGVRLKLLFDHPNNLGLFCALMICCAIYLLFKRKAWGGFVFNLGLIAVASVPLFMAVSRGSLIACLVTVFAICVFHLRSRWRLYITLGAALVLAGIVVLWQARPPQLENMFSSSSVYTRFVIWEAALDSYRQKPVFGNGMRSFRPIYEQYIERNHEDLQGRYEEMDETAGTPHNIFLSVASEMGSVGLAFFAVFLVLSGVSAFRAAAPYNFFAPILIFFIVFGLNQSWYVDPVERCFFFTFFGFLLGGEGKRRSSA